MAKRALCVIFLCCVSLKASADGEVRDERVIPADLSSDYLPPSAPAHAVDNHLNVCFTYPAFDEVTAAQWTAPHIRHIGGSHPSQVNEYVRYIFHFEGSAGNRIRNIVGRLFPQTKSFRQAPPFRQCDLSIATTLRSEASIDPKHHLQTLTLAGILNVTGENGTPVTTIEALGTAERKTKSWHISFGPPTRNADDIDDWDNNRALGRDALREMLDDLCKKLLSDPGIAQVLNEKLKERARPSELEVTAKFDDSASFFPNGRLDAGEQAKLLFTIRNRGAGPAFGVRIRLSSTAKSIILPTEMEVGDMAPSLSKDLTVTITASADVETALQSIRVETLEKRGYGGRPVVVELATTQLKKPALEITDISLNDGTGRAKGDGNGRPSNGETIEAAVLVRNSGPGDAVGARVTLESLQGIEVLDHSVDIPAIPANAVREARLLLSIPVIFSGKDLPLTVRVVETRGVQVAQASKTTAWPVEAKRPNVEITYRLFDGNSPNSRGDRDGVANNGETIELAVTPVNRGALVARGVRIEIKSRQPSVTVSPETLMISELPPFSEGPEQRVRVVVPRTLGHNTVIDKLPLVVKIAQLDFEFTEQPLALPFQARRPQLQATVATLSPLIEGTSAAFALEIQNRGGLAAENVRVEVNGDNSGLELLDKSGAPVRKLFLAVGTVGPQTTAKVPIKAHISRNLPKAPASLDIIVLQADFPTVTTQAALDIQREEVVVISTAPAAAPLPEAPSRRATPLPAMISFQRWENGQRLDDESIALPFQVQSQSGLETVRLEQNQRVVDVGMPKVLREQRVFAWQYVPHVRLDYGENVFNVVVVTAEGVRSNYSILINRNRPQGKLWVAVIGISRYGNKGVGDLAFARDDATAILNYYRQFGLPEEQLISLFDEEATLGNIKRSLGTVLAGKATNPDDTAILYFAGHGDRELDRGSLDSDGFTKYLLPYDTNPSDLFSSALSMEELSRILLRLAPERVVLIIDSCFSGAAGGRTLYVPGMTRRTPLSDEFLARMASAGKGRAILTASSGQEVAHESSEFRHGVFTHYLLEALNGEADADHDSHVDIDEIYKYVSQKVSAATNGHQTPMKNTNLSGTVVIGRHLPNVRIPAAR